MVDTQTIAIIGLGVSGANFVLNWGVAFYVHLMNKDKATTDSIKTLEKGLNAKAEEHGERIASLETAAGFSRSTDCGVHAERIAQLEANIGKAPTRQELSEIHGKINEVAGCVSRLEGEFSGAMRTLTLIHETLMERGK